MLRSAPQVTMTVFLFFVAACQQADAPQEPTAKAVPRSFVLVEEVAKVSSSDLTIPYKKYELENGLTVILHPDNSDPLVHVDVTYHVGSAREQIGKSGFAHFFEHMMFQGSENVADEQHFKIVSESGGTMNGTTNTDRTNYFQTVPANQLEKMLWLEADRMGFLLDAVTQEKFEVQRETVKNERGQRVDNQPYGRVYERVNQALYPEGHPYSWPTIGYIEDLNRVDVNDLKAFFLRWYGPNNAALTIGGKFDEAQVLEWIDKYFGPIPRGPEVADPEISKVELDADRYISMEDKVAMPLLYMAFPTVHALQEDEAPLDVLTSILGEGETSLLYKNLVKNQLAVQANASHYCQELACNVSIVVLANPSTGKSLADIEEIVRDTLLELGNRQVVEDDFTRVKMGLVANRIYGLESVARKVGQLAFYEMITGDPNYTAENISRYENVTADDVMRVYDAYIKGKPAVIMSTVPEGQVAAIAHGDTWRPYERVLPDYASISESDLAYRRAEDAFDRSMVPPAGGNPSIILPEIWRDTLDNGVEVLGALNVETPTVAIQMRIAAGQRDEPLEKLGLAVMTAAMLNESTQESTNEEISNALQKLGSSVNIRADNEYTTLTIRSLSEHLSETLAIAAEQLLKPKFDAADFDRVKSQTVQLIRDSKTRPASIAAEVYQLILYGDENSFSYLNVGTAETVSNLTLDDIKAFYSKYYSSELSSIIAVSDLPRQELLEELKVFEDLQGDGVQRAPLRAFPDTGSTKIYLVNQPGAAQSEIRIGKRALTYDATGEYYRANLMNFALGGAFNSRINLNLREDKGYSYGARSGFGGTEDYGAFTAQAAVRTDATADSIVQFESEIQRYVETGISEEELSFTRKSIGQRDARSFETPGQKLGFLAQILIYNLDESFVEEQKNILESIGEAEINALAKKHLTMDKMVILVVGDKATILPELQELGYEIVEIDADGNPAES